MMITLKRKFPTIIPIFFFLFMFWDNNRLKLLGPNHKVPKPVWQVSWFRLNLKCFRIHESSCFIITETN